MGKLWADMKRDELILNYNGILWGLREQVHCRVRRFNKTPYVIPKICTIDFFEREIKPGMLKAKSEIERILKRRGVVRIPSLKMQVMGDTHADMLDIGWKTYKAIHLSILNHFGKNSE